MPKRRNRKPFNELSKEGKRQRIIVNRDSSLSDSSSSSESLRELTSLSSSQTLPLSNSSSSPSLSSAGPSNLSDQLSLSPILANLNEPAPEQVICNSSDDEVLSGNEGGGDNEEVGDSEEVGGVDSSDDEYPFFSDSDIEVNDADENDITLSVIDPSGAHSIASEDTEEQEPEDPASAVRLFFQQWSLLTKCPNSHLSSLCSGLKRVHPQCFANLPVDARTIKNTPAKKTVTREVGRGEYVHIGVVKQLRFILSIIEPVPILHLLFNIDGLPLYNNSVYQLWPITMSLPCIPELKGKVLPIGLFYGPEKPESNSTYLQEFTEELVSLLNNDLVNNDVNIEIVNLGFSCDMPAKNFLLGTVAFNGYHSCTKCKIEGEWINHRVVFKDLDCPLRTDEEFRQRADENYRPLGRTTPLLNVPGFHFTNSIPLDYMHLVCIGVMKKLIKTWMASVWSAQQKLNISDSLLRFRHYIPPEFARKPRELKVIKYWKATELRMFLLYLGPVVLKDTLPPTLYEHFLYLHVAMTILLDPVRIADQNRRNFARKLLLSFVENVAGEYHDCLLTANFHNLLHLVDDADYFIQIIPNFTLDDISCFPFENFLQQLKSLVTGYNRPLQQITRRLGELFSSDVLTEQYRNNLSKDPYFSDPHRNGPLPVLCRNPQFNKYNAPNLFLSLDPPNNVCIMEGNELVCIENFAYSNELQCQVVVGRKYVHVSNFYDAPLCASSSVGIFKVKGLSALQTWPLNRIIRKCFQIPYSDNSFIVFSFHHS